MADPRFRDSDITRLLVTGRLDEELDIRPPEPGECECRDRAYAEASRRQRPEYGQVFPDEVRDCLRKEAWCDGAVVLSCSASTAVFGYLDRLGFRSEDGSMDRELLARLERAEARERVTSLRRAG